MSNHRPYTCGRARLFAVLCALCLCVACVCAPLAQAADTVTRSIAGINFTLPADWEEVQISEGVDANTGLANVQAYTKNDGFFFAGMLPDADLASGTLDEVEQAASLLDLYLAGTPLASVACSGQLEQGVPTLTLYTDELALNGVQYAATVKLFVVNTSDFAGGVIMASLLPASGQVSNNLDDLLTELAEDTRVDVAGISYEVPAGAMVMDGYAFGIDFGLAVTEDGAVFLTDIPDLADTGTMTVDDLQALIDQVFASEDFDTVLDEEVLEMWSGAYSFLGFPTAGIELTAQNGGADDVLYMAITASVTPAGLSFMMIVQPVDSAFAETLLASAQATVEPLTAPGSALPDIEVADTNADPGFVVGV